jgi:hypothetical protein
MPEFLYEIFFRYQTLDAVPTDLIFFFPLDVLFVYRFSDISSLSSLISVQALSSLFLSLSSFHIYFVCDSFFFFFLHKVIIITLYSSPDFPLNPAPPRSHQRPLNVIRTFLLHGAHADRADKHAEMHARENGKEDTVEVLDE